jgi:CRISPR-associated protein Csm2
MNRRKQQNLTQEETKNLQKIVEAGDALITVRWADELGQSLANNRLTTNQIRNFFGEVRQIQLTWDQGPEAAYRRAVLLIPKLGYHAKRARGRAQRGLEDLERVLTPALELVAEAPETQRRTYFMNFVDFFEAILAYHKKYGGRD